ncbi:protein adenylyltransferase SelO [Mesobacillus maritimus]|uniref:Protein nucleotidyltransferase YdiU n=1 Tax=Mesobacillus maritimus TaxID=1643336 RepID=A0ABS7K6I5_9BACI|nr:YdiU family protein [Mesobacillus maritimus]MBY0097888.1 YdiU family protein [Mesobacillus maritimus]
MTINQETGWNFDNSYTRLPKPFYTSQNPAPVRSPELVIFNEALAQSLGLNPVALQSEAGVQVFAGNQVPKGSSPLAQAYAGHQFGHINMLGDGRAILLGEQITPKGERVDIQLKGSGRTPFSRGGDGRATLGPMLREYIISEAMHALGIPTTRSLAVVSTGETVVRETGLPGAILTRVAASHIRVGTFQYAAGKGGDDNGDDLRALADYTIERHYPEIKKDEHRYLSFLKEVIKRQAKLISKWQLVGFIHGVMNTDNMTISGESIDYGPCAFMNEYDPTTVFSSIDTQGRYAYGNQPAIGGWNLARFAESLIPLLHENEEEAVKLAQDTISDYPEQYRRNWLMGMRAKLGLFHEAREDEALIENLLNMMKKYRADFTNTFRDLTYDSKEQSTLFQSEEFIQWNHEWQERLSNQEESEEASRQLMRSNNPVVIPRNHKVEEALEAAVNDGDYHVMEKLLNVLASPYELSPDKDEYCTLPAPSAKPYRTFCGT